MILMIQECINNVITTKLFIGSHLIFKNIHYRFFFLNIFFELQINLKGDHDLWKYFYTNKKHDIEKT